MWPATHHLEAVAVDVARTAALLVVAASGSAEAAATKSSPTDVVTHTDLESDKLIRRELLARCPGSAIVGEEYQDGAGTNRVGWIVDPIDGTVNFLYDLPVVTISIAATIDGRVVAGAVNDVHRRETFSAHIGAGARRNGAPIVPSSVDRLDRSLVGTGFAHDADLRARQASVLSDVLPRCRDIPSAVADDERFAEAFELPTGASAISVRSGRWAPASARRSDLVNSLGGAEVPSVRSIRSALT